LEKNAFGAGMNHNPPGLGSMADISVVIVNWNSKDYVRKCLASLLFGRTATDLEIIVVDAGSFDGCGEMLAVEFPMAVFIQVSKNVGFGRANNAGSDRATRRIIWFLNPDTEVRGAAATVMLDALDTTEGAGMVGARLLNSNGTLQTSCVQSLPTVLNQAFDSELLRRLFPKSGLWGISALKSKDGPVEVEAVPGACIMLRRADFERIGRFDSGYFMYGEDMDLCFKVRKVGLKVIYVPGAEVIHHGGGSSRKQFSKFSVVLMRESVAYYLKNNFSATEVWFYRLCMATSALVRLAALSARRPILRGVSREENSVSLQKWVAILRWCLGGERWAKVYSQDR
jgi:N-acetylglucosaminyl-diphospho-decaprenol L-rhamnosyltransferase